MGARHEDVIPLLIHPNPVMAAFVLPVFHITNGPLRPWALSDSGGIWEFKPGPLGRRERALERLVDSRRHLPPDVYQVCPNRVMNDHHYTPKFHHKNWGSDEKGLHKAPKLPKRP